MRRHVDDVDFAAAAAYERRFRHDVMAHVHAFGDVAPAARPFIHLGATSAFVTDNADLILMRRGLELLRAKVVRVVRVLAAFARRCGCRTSCSTWPICRTGSVHCPSAASRAPPARRRASSLCSTGTTSACV